MKKIVKKSISILFILFFSTFSIFAAEKANIIVAKDGSGDFTTIQAAINSVPANNASYKIILIKDGLYNEHIFVDKSYVALVGESRENTRIEFALDRDLWLAEKGTNSGSGVIAIAVSASNGTSTVTTTNVVIANLSVTNTLASNNDKYTHVIRGEGKCDKIYTVNCNVYCTGKDTHALWNTLGTYYQANCSFKGGIDAVCPRGSSYDVECEYLQPYSSAPVWQQGNTGANQKYVIRNGVFRTTGTSDCKLLNGQLEPNFYFMDCSLTKVNTQGTAGATGKAYYFNTHSTGGDLSFHANNLNTAPGSPAQIDVTASFALNGWDAENLMPEALPFAAIPQPWNKAYDVNATPTLKWIKGRNAVSHNVYFGTTTNPTLVTNTTARTYSPGTLSAGTYYWRVDALTDTETIQGTLWSFTVTVGGTTNLAPTVNITSPAKNATFISPANVTIEATAADADGSVDKVEFYNGTTLLGTSTSSPYSYTWTGVATGTYTVTAKVTDNGGLAVTSSPVNVTVNAGGVPPTVSITSPANNISFEAPATIAINADASDTDGTIAKVEFYNGTTLLSTDAIAPYSFSWANVGPGTYSITAKATDNNGATATSNLMSVTVTNSSGSLTIQGETACEIVTGILSESKNAGFNGAGYLNFDNAVGTNARWNVSSVGTQTVTLSIRYAGTTERNMSLSVNGEVQVSIVAMPSTGAFTTWNTATAQVTLADGINTIKLTSLSVDGGANVDEMTFFSPTVKASTSCDNIITGLYAETEYPATRLYPNPSTASFTIRAREDIKVLSIINMVGVIVYSRGNIPSGQDTEIASEIGEGTYFVQLHYQSETNEILKLVKLK